MAYLIPFVLAGPVLGPLLGYAWLSGKFLRTGEPEAEIKSVAPSEALDKTNAFLRENFIDAQKRDDDQGLSRRESLARKREMFNAMGKRVKTKHAIIPVEAPKGEWIVPKTADTDIRLLYIHGGGHSVGSPLSHRQLTTELAERAGCAVFAPDYGLIPENPRLSQNADVRAAYDYVIANGPKGEGEARAAFIGGDSAGGSLTLSLTQALVADGARLPDAVFGLSASTDFTLKGKSGTENYETDLMLQPLADILFRAPKPLALLGMSKLAGARVNDPRISPLYGRMKGHPPTLLQVSGQEMLLDDNRMYAARAQAAGADVRLQIWDGDRETFLPHVWPMFKDLPETDQALDEVADFLKSHVQ